MWNYSERKQIIKRRVTKTKKAYAIKYRESNKVLKSSSRYY